MLRRNAVRSLVVVAAAAGPMALAAGARQVAVTPQLRWRAGDEVRFERTRTRIDASVAAKPQTARTPIVVGVGDVRESGHLVTWRHGASRVEGATPAAGQALEAMQQAVDGLEFELELGPDGRFESLRNWAAVRERTVAMIDRLLPAATPAEEQARTQLKGAFASRRNVETLLLREVQLFFMFYGRELQQGETERWDDALPNPLGGEPLPGAATLTAVRVGSDAATLRYTLVFDRDRSPQRLAEAMATLAERMGRRPEDLRKLFATLDVQDEAELVFDLASRWPLSLTHERRIRLADRFRTDRVAFVRQP